MILMLRRERYFCGRHYYYYCDKNSVDAIGVSFALTRVKSALLALSSLSLTWLIRMVVSTVSWIHTHMKRISVFFSSFHSFFLFHGILCHIMHVQFCQAPLADS